MKRDATEGPVFLAKVKGVEPEQFVYITMAVDFTAIKRMSGTLSEADVWLELRKSGMADTEIRSRIEATRLHPA